jgi:hypothetical protein
VRMGWWVPRLLVVLVAAACSPSPGDLASLDAGADAGCPGVPPRCCSGGCNGNALVPPLCLPSHRWICPPDSVSPDDCADAGVRWCSGGPVDGG